MYDWVTQAEGYMQFWDYDGNGKRCEVQGNWGNSCRIVRVGKVSRRVHLFFVFQSKMGLGGGEFEMKDGKSLFVCECVWAGKGGGAVGGV